MAVAGLRTVLQIINEVQTNLRLPKSTDVTDSHAALLLGFINEVQRDYMPQVAVWDALKTYGTATAVVPAEGDAATLTLVVTDKEIDSIRYLCVQGATYGLTKLSDEAFIDYKKANGTAAEPKAYRIRSRNAGELTIELAPTPDKEYTLDTEILIKPPRLTAKTDYPMLDPDTIALGAKMLATAEEGLSFEEKLAAFQAKILLQGQSQGEGNWGDIEAE